MYCLVGIQHCCSGMKGGTSCLNKCNVQDCEQSSLGSEKLDFLKLTVVTVLQCCVLTEDSYFQRSCKAGSITGEVILLGR